jgi:hypothetical protein
VNAVAASLRSSWRPAQLSASEQVIVQMLNRLPTFNTNIAHQTPAAISVTRLTCELCGNSVHARKERRVFRNVSQVCGGANMFAREDQEMKWRLWRNVFNGKDKVG